MSSSLAVFHTKYLADGAPGAQDLLDQFSNTVVRLSALLGWFLSPSSLPGAADAIYIYYFLAFERVPTVLARWHSLS